MLPLRLPLDPELDAPPVLPEDDDWPREEDGIPPEPDCEPLLEGMLDELPPPDLLELLPELPELPPEDPDEGEEEPGELGLLGEDDCCSGQPPIKKAVTALSARSRPAAMGNRL